MNWRRGLFRLWIVGAALFVIAIAAISYRSIKAEFTAAREERAFADQVYKRFYSDIPREQFDKKIAEEPEPSAQIEAIVAQLDTARPLSQWSDDELMAYSFSYYFSKYKEKRSALSPWFTVATWAGIASGVPLVVLILGASLVWAFSGFAAMPKQLDPPN
jgi:hypothetical protein